MGKRQAQAETSGAAPLPGLSGGREQLHGRQGLEVRQRVGSKDTRVSCQAAAQSQW